MFALVGQMLWIDDLRLMMYVCSPRLSSLLELKQLNIYLSDIPLYDVTRELILLNQQRIAEIDIAYVLCNGHYGRTIETLTVKSLVL